MAELLAIEWEHAYLAGVVADVAPGKVQVRRTFLIQRPVRAGSASGTLPVDWFQPEMSRQGIPPGPALIALPRDEAVVKRLDMPDVSDGELPTLVRFQAGAKSSVALDDLSLDFIPLPRHGEIPGREVLLATVPKLTLDEITTLCRSAGIEAKVIGLTGVAVAEFVARAEHGQEQVAPGASLVVARHGTRIEISVLRRGHLLFSHSTRLPDDASGQEAQAITAEVSRALVALRGTGTEVKVERVWTLVSNAEHLLLAESLHRRLSCEVQALDPFSVVECDTGVLAAGADRAVFAGPLGMLLSRADARVPAIDFLSPRRPVAQRNDRKRKLIIAGAGGAVVAGLLIFAQWQRLGRLDAEIEEANVRENGLNEKLALLKPTTESAALVSQWETDGVDWLQEFAELSQRMPSTERLYLYSLDCRPRNGTTPPQLIVAGYARSRDDVLELNPRFAADEHFKGIPVKERGAAPKEVEHYKFSFEKELRLLPPVKKKPAVAGATQAPPASGPATDGSADKPSSTGEGAAS